MQRKWTSVLMAMLMTFTIFPSSTVTAFAAENSTAGTVTKTITIPVKNATDDMEERADGTLDFDSSDLEITYEDPTKTDVKNQIIGIRFADIALPKGAQVKNAYIQFSVDEPNKSSNPFDVKIQAEDTVNAAAYENVNKAVSSRTRTTDIVSWKDAPLWAVEHEANENERTPDLSSLIQGIVNKNDWKAGNAINFIFSGQGNRNAESFEGAGGAADQIPTLYLTYTGDDIPTGGGNTGGDDNGNNTANVSNIALTPGKDSSELNFAWYSDKSTKESQVQIVKKSDYDGKNFPTDKAVTFKGTRNDGNEEHSSNKVTATGLAQNTQYVYRLGDGTNWSSVYNYTTQNNSTYNFLVAGDPQIGASGDINKDKNGWVDTMNKAASAFPNSSFVLSVGDQVNNGSEVVGGKNETEYSAFFTPEQFKSLPIAAIAGNHETYGVGHNTHFNAPNESTYGAVNAAPTSGADYYFTYGNTLFMMLNSNDVNSADHQAFMKDAIAKNPSIQWKVVSLHHSVYSSADHATDSDIISRRNTLPQIFTDLDIDVVLDGHDHCYTRTYQMVGNEPKTQQKDYKVTVTNPSGTSYEKETITNPTGVVYITTNSASGSKYYEMQQANGKSYYEAVKQQIHVPTFSNVEVDDNSISITTYRTDNMEVTDKYTLAKKDITNVPAPVISDLTFAPGSSASELNFNWYTDNSSGEAEVQLAKKSDYSGSSFPEAKAKTFGGKQLTGNNNNIANKVTVTGLSPNTEYVYRVGNGISWSQIYNYSTEDNSSYNFLMAGDPQIGASGDIQRDKNGWLNTMNKASQAFPNTSFLLSVGDQVNNGGETANSKGVKDNTSEYEAYFAPDIFRNLPIAAVAGNHEASLPGHSTHFNNPNESLYGIVSGKEHTGKDYYFTYGNTLFLMLNSNDINSADHEAFMKDAIAKNPNATWKVVSLHHSIYSSADHETDSDIIARRNSMPQIFTALGIDAVLDGHDHCYTRSYQMVNNIAAELTKDEKTTKTTQSGAAYVDEKVTDPTGVVYITANSASGSKYYEMQEPNKNNYYEAVKMQLHVPTLSNVEVSGNSLTITTYRMDNMEITDRYTIAKTNVKNIQVLNDNAGKVVAAINASADKANISVDVNKDKVVSKEIFDTIKGQDKNISFIQSGLEWSFNGKDITGSTKNIDMSVNVAGLYNSISANRGEIAAKSGNAGVTVVSFANNGQLPGKAAIKVKLDSQWLSDPTNAKKSLFVYYYNESSKKLEEIANGLKADNGYVQFNITHNSDYVVSDTDLSEPVEMSIGDARAKASGKAIVTGVVTNIVGSNVFMQDDNAGICFYNTAKADVKKGDKIKVTGVLSNYHELIEITPKASADVTVLSSNNNVAPKVVTIAQINDTLQSQLILIKGATLKNIDNKASSTIEDSTGNVVIYAMPVLTDIQAGDKVDVLASVTRYGTTLELSVSSADDVMKAGLADVNAVTQKINAIPTNVTLAHKAAIAAARAAFEALTADQKLMVKNIGKLVAAEQAILDLEAVPDKLDNQDPVKVVDAIKDAIKNNTNVPVVDISTSTIVSKDIFNAIKGQDKTVTFVGKDVTWTFNGKDIKVAVTKDIDLSLKSVSDVLKAKEAAKVKGITGKDVQIAAFSFVYEGQLPGTATVKVFVGKEWANKTVNLCRYYSDKDTYDTISTNIKVDSEGYLTYTTDHCSDYFITEASVKLPQTGSPIDMNILMVLGLLLVCGGTVLIRKNKLQK